MKKLKPCPFCGGKVKFEKNFNHEIIGIECKCGMNIYFWNKDGMNIANDDVANLVKKWNERHE